MLGFQVKSLLFVIPRDLAFSVDFSSVLRSLYGKMSEVFMFSYKNYFTFVCVIPWTSLIPTVLV